MRSNKPSAYLSKVQNGHFLLEATTLWKATDLWGNRISSGRTKKEVMEECRRRGYVPRRA